MDGPKPSKTKVAWEGKTHAPVRYGRVEGEVVIEIITLGTHKHVRPNPDVYAVKVLGRELPSRFRNVADARAAGLEAYQATTSAT